MKLPILWLKDYIQLSQSPEKLAESLTLSGNKVEALAKKDGEDVIEIEVTTNRPDTLSILGLAREVSAITGKSVTAPKISKEPTSGLTDKKSVSITIQDSKACPLYTARLIRNVLIQTSPVDIQKKLSLVDLRPINSAVDVTNFVLFEMGQPLHAFDFDKIVGGKIIVRFAKLGEKFLALDGVEYTLDEKTLVIADAEKPIAMAGVIGGKLTEVTSLTKNILLESALFDPALVRRASKRTKISTDSSYRFERGVDREAVSRASRRAMDLILKLAGGTETSGLLVKESKNSNKPAPIQFSTEWLKNFLGLEVKEARASQILKSLGFGVQSAKKGTLKVLAPSWRRDCQIPEDLAEEILRIEGFDKVPVKIAPMRHAIEPFIDRKAEQIFELKKYLASLGLSEIVTYSLLSEKMIKESGVENSTPQKIKNALSADIEYFRPHLKVGALNAVAFNLNRKASSLKLFEVGRVIFQGAEKISLGITLCGNFEENWRRRYEAGFFELKGILKNVEHHLGAAIPVSPEALSAGVRLAWGIEKPVYYAEIFLDEILGAPQEVRRLKPIAKYPSVKRDIAFLIDRKIEALEIEKIILENGGSVLKGAQLFDEYAGKNIPSGKRSLAFSLEYQKESGTFTDDEIQALQQKVGEALKTKFGVEFR